MKSGEVTWGAWGVHGYQIQSGLPGHFQGDPWKTAVFMPGGMPGSSSSEYRHIFKGSVWKKLLEQMKGGQGKGFHLLYLKSHLVSWQEKSQTIFFGDPATLKDLSDTSFWLETQERKGMAGICEADLSTVSHAYHHPTNASNLDNYVKLDVNLPHSSLKANQSVFWPGVHNPPCSVITIKGPAYSLICYWLQGMLRSQGGCNSSKYIFNNE